VGGGKAGKHVAPYLAAQGHHVTNGRHVRGHDHPGDPRPLLRWREVRKEMARDETFYSINKAKDVLGFNPQHSWREVLGT
jgi:nucleoside-diphosphate-sugar epimerase